MSTTPVKSKKDMQAEAKAKALQYKKTLSPARTKKSSSSTTPKKQSVASSSPKTTPKSVQLANAREYQRQLQMKKSPSPVPQRCAPVTNVTIAKDSDAVDVASSGSFETANWSGLDSTIQTESTQVRELKRQAKEWEAARDHAEAERVRLQELIGRLGDECCDMDVENQ